jgi:hypothetical protein
MKSRKQSCNCAGVSASKLPTPASAMADGLEHRLTGDRLVHRAARRADEVENRHEHVGRLLPGKTRQVELAQRLRRAETLDLDGTRSSSAKAPSSIFRTLDLPAPQSP